MSCKRTLSLHGRIGLPARAAWVALACLNLALMPCALLASGERACPGCPPESGQMHSVEQHAEMHAHGSMNDRAHACDAADGECCGVAGLGKTERPTKPAKSADAASAALPLPPVDITLSVTSHGLATNATGPPISPSSRRLHARFCVYLD